VAELQGVVNRRHEGAPRRFISVIPVPRP